MKDNINTVLALFGGAMAVYILAVLIAIFASSYSKCQAAERTQARPTYDYGKSRSFDQQNSGNAHYQESRPANGYRSTIERTQNSRSVESQRAQQKQLNYENRNSYQKQK
jgi:hypothetical protein